MTGDSRGGAGGRSKGFVLGWVVAGFGALSSLVGVVADFVWPLSSLADLPTAAVGLLCGVAGFFLGARWFGISVLLLSAAAIILADLAD